ncbi:hypothetical protein [Propionivibrio sp.]|uniref:hypothetical protein n=1 Tax=Propionivibrio sp. TaxID=2212460 RepID=UPI003BF3BC16
MNLTIPGVTHVSDDIQDLRRVIAHIAGRCGLSLADKSAVRRVMDGDFSHCQTTDHDHQACHELPAMLTLLFRLEASSSEDLGISGLRRPSRQTRCLRRALRTRKKINASRT